MFKHRLNTLNKKRLQRWLFFFFLTLLIPTALLVQQSHSRLKWETFHQHQQVAQSLTNRIDSHLISLINKEDQRSFADYAFLNVAGDIQANFLQRSPLSQFPVSTDFSGLLGYFQVDDEGYLSTPLLPTASAASYGISAQELFDRQALVNTMEEILVDNNLIQKTVTITNDIEDQTAEVTTLESTEAVAEEITEYQSQTVFDKLNAFKNRSLQSIKKEDFKNKVGVSSVNADTRVLVKEKPAIINDSKKTIGQQQIVSARNEKIALPEVATEYSILDSLSSKRSSKPRNNQLQEKAKQPLRIKTFESEIDPFDFSQLDSGHFVLFRKVWLNGQRYVQGLLIDQHAFINDLITQPFNETSLSNISQLKVMYQGTVLTETSMKTEQVHESLYRTGLSTPFSHLQLSYHASTLPIGVGGRVVLWLGFVLTGVLVIGFYLMYRLGVGQIRLVNQQQDFISAVSHELKTPLTSIRMYGEMLREGWTPEEKKHQYYNFIFDESERLTRLINNVLQLARMTRNSQQATLIEYELGDVMRELTSKISSQVERSGFELQVLNDDSVTRPIIMIDMDWLTQVIINLVDNAIKFSMNAEHQCIHLSCVETSNQHIKISVRDFGQGIDKQQIQHIFELFYRTENELTRETKGTGIGLSLVQQMIHSMNGHVTVENKQPGAEFSIYLPIFSDGTRLKSQ